MKPGRFSTASSELLRQPISGLKTFKQSDLRVHKYLLAMSRLIIDTDTIETECLNIVHPRQGSRARSRVTLFLGDHLLYWKSQRQALVAWSATEVEVEATAIAF